MGKKNKEKNLGRALIKDRFGTGRNRRNNSDSYLHTADIQDGYNLNLLNLQSVTEESSFQEFLATAELAGTEFQAEKLNIKFVNSKSNIGILSKDKAKEVIKLHETNKEFLKIPRRPKWDKTTTPQELEMKEKEEFFNWKRKLALLQEIEDLVITPYEKNLEFWRQLWRVVERSDVVVQIVDARNPLLFRCEDLEQYVKEVNQNKLNMILINKADFLTQTQREIWAKYFSKINVHVAFFSATLANENYKACDKLLQDEIVSQQHDQNSKEKSDFKELNDDEINKAVESVQRLEFDDSLYNQQNSFELKNQIINSSNLLSREELIHLFKNIVPAIKNKKSLTTIGLVGYPNVGKSSTINALLMDKKVSVSATPGKTKHFQTLYLDNELLLCDCPGLVMPSFVSTKAEMILNGILPIDRINDHVPPVTLLGTLIPRQVIENLYGIMIPLPIEGEDPDRPPIAEEILNAHGFNRGFMTQNGQPDNARSSRYIIKDFVNGKLLYCTSPPNYNQKEFHTFVISKNEKDLKINLPEKTLRAIRPVKPTTEELDKNFFKNHFTGVHTKGNKFAKIQTNSNDPVVESGVKAVEKSWKMNKINKRGKKEKLRKVYSYLDEH